MIETDNVRNWASIIDGVTLNQAIKTGRHPRLAGPVALMPDAHLGIGATVGSVIALDGAIIPAAVGVDIGCGMVALNTGLNARDLPDSLEGFLPEVARSIPAGMGRGHSQTTEVARRWMAAHPNESVGVGGQLWGSASSQLGSLGGGNHFFEVCLDETDGVWLVLHSGSRGVGNKLAQKHMQVARALEQGLEDKDLNCFVQGTAEFDSYIHDMLWAQDYAAENRRIMVLSAWRSFLTYIGVDYGVTFPDAINCHHNFAQLEGHIFAPGFASMVWVTRKGAIQALPGQLGVIPGSMGAASYIVEGKGNPLSYYSAPHGAGRTMSRGQAKRELTVEAFRETMNGKVWQESQAQSLLDESPGAYKDIDVVMADSSDLVTVVHTLHQILNYKGVSDRR